MNKQVIEFLTANPKSNKGQIADGVNLRGLGLFNLLKKMVNEKQITVEGEGHDATYVVAIAEVDTEEEVATEVQPFVEQASPSEETQVTEEQPDELETPENKDEENVKVDSIQKATTPRNNNKFKFNGEELGKGTLVRTIIAKYVNDNPNTTYKKLLEVFPTTLLKRFGAVEEIEKAREISGAKYDRYFFKDEHVIKLKDKKVVVCNQWTTDNIQPFLKVAQDLGFVFE